MYKLLGILLIPRKQHKKRLAFSQTQTVFHKYRTAQNLHNNAYAFPVSSSVALFCFFSSMGVMLLAQIAMVEALCRNAEVVGAIMPNKPRSSSDELNPMINR